MLRDDVLYMVVSQANYGLKFLAAARPNVLIMNSGEYLGSKPYAVVIILITQHTLS